MGFDLARDVRPLHVTPPRAIHRFRSLLVKQKRHRDHDSVTVTIAEGFRSASFDLSIFIRSDVRQS
jgi:hypothetical protein